MIGKFHTWCSHWVPRRPLKVWIFPGQVWAEGSGRWGAADPEPFKRSLPHFKPFFCCPLLLFLVIIAEEETHLPPQVETIFLCCGDGRALSHQPVLFCWGAYTSGLWFCADVWLPGNSWNSSNGKQPMGRASTVEWVADRITWGRDKPWDKYICELQCGF